MAKVKVESITDVKQLLSDLRSRARAAFVGDLDAFRCDDAIGLLDNISSLLSDIVNSDMAMREEDEGRKSPLLERVRAAIARAEGCES